MGSLHSGKISLLKNSEKSTVFIYVDITINKAEHQGFWRRRCIEVIQCCIEVIQCCLLERLAIAEYYEEIIQTLPSATDRGITVDQL